MKEQRILILGRSDIEKLLSVSDCIAAVENAFRMYTEGRILGPGVLDIPGRAGTFHVKGAGIPFDSDKIYIAVKVNGNFPDNSKNFGLPTIQGAILLFDGVRGCPLALMDSTEITALRTAAATAAAARHLARKSSRVVTICGCGRQGRSQLITLLNVLSLARVYAYDQNEPASENFAATMSSQIGIPVLPVRTLEEAARDSDVIITCTTSRQFFLRKEHVRPGTFVAAVGADSPDKQEIDPDLLKSAKVVADLLLQCQHMGDLHHAVRANRMQPEDVYAELGEILSGRKPGRSSDEEIFVFDSTGSAFQDVAAAAIAYERALQSDAGLHCNLFV